MPLYEYRCTKCQHNFEQQQAVGAPAPACPRCGSPSRKVFSSVGLIFKGSGFHTTDYRKAAPSDDAPGKSESPSKTAPSKTAESGESAKDSSTKDSSAKDSKSTTDSKPSTGS
jgi:putative FmdB family regulatory protein